MPQLHPHLVPIFDEIVRRNPGEPEFRQAAQEVLESLGPVVERPAWTFLTSHASVLLEVARAPDATVREIAKRSDLTERQAHRVLADLVADRLP